MNKKDVEKMKKRANRLFKDGKTKEEIKVSLRKECKDMTYREFDNKFGRYIRRLCSDVEEENAVKKAVEKNTSTIAKKTTVTTDKDGNNTIDTVVEQGTPMDEILAEAGFDPEVFEVTAVKRSIWDAQTSEGIQQMESLKVSVTPKKPKFSEADMLSMLQERTDRIAAGVNSRVVPRLTVSKKEQIAVWHIADLHYGRNCQKEEVGIQWGLKEADQDIEYMLDQVIDELKANKPKYLVLAMTGDGINSEGTGATNHGTVQDNAAHFNKIVNGYINATMNIIDRIIEEAKVPVDFVHVVGNHDTDAMYTIYCGLKAAYRNNPNVLFRNELNRRKYRTYGDNLFMFTHGDKEKKRIFNVPENEVPNAYKNTSKTFIFTEHLHTFEAVTNGRNLLFRTPCVAPPEHWSSDCGFIGSQRGSILYFFNNKDGYLGHKFINVYNNTFEENVLNIDDVFAA